MSTDLKVNINAQGYGSQELRDPEGGNNSKGVLEQMRPTSVMVDSRGRSKSAMKEGMREGKEARGRKSR